jgi:hypothetical protein
MEIYVEWVGNSGDKIRRPYTFKASLSDSVRSFREQIKAKTGIPHSRQCLVSEGRLLEDDKTVADLVLSSANVMAEKGEHQNVKIVRWEPSETESRIHGSLIGRGGVCVGVDPQNGKWMVQVDLLENKRFRADFAPDDLEVLLGSKHYPWFLHEDFEGHDNPHDVKVLISPAVLKKFGDHNLSELESASGAKTRVFSLQIECGTYTLWYSKTKKEAVSFFSRPMQSTEVHHTTPLLGVVDLQDASMYAHDFIKTHQKEFHLTIILGQKDDQTPESTKISNKKLSEKYFYCMKQWEALRIVFDEELDRRHWIKTLQSCDVLLGIVLFMQFQFFLTKFIRNWPK